MLARSAAVTGKSCFQACWFAYYLGLLSRKTPRVAIMPRMLVLVTALHNMIRYTMMTLIRLVVLLTEYLGMMMLRMLTVLMARPLVHPPPLSADQEC